jgi:predicted Zn-dependent peptidase
LVLITVFYQQTTLDNGITVITEHMDAVRSVSVGIWFRVGSRDETDEQQGLSHFMEHMMFKGTARRDALAISQDFESIGAEQNAFTSKEYTCYYSRFIDEKAPEIMDILGDMVTASVFSQDAIDSEREVVIEEIARSEDTPDDYIFELFTQGVFPSHQLGRPVIGTREIVGSFMHDDCIGYRDKHYHAGNCVVVASGNIEHAAFVSLCEQHLCALPQGTINARNMVPEQKRARFVTMRKETEQAHIIYGMPGIPLGDDDRFAGSLLDTALGGGMSSRLFQEVREKRGLAYAVYTSTMPYLGAGQFLSYVGTRPANIEEVITILRREFASVIEKGLTREELERVREYVIGHIVLSMESTSQRMLRLGKSAISRNELLSLDELIARYRAVTLEDTQRVVSRVLGQAPTIAIISPREEREIEEALASLIA